MAENKDDVKEIEVKDEDKETTVDVSKEKEANQEVKKVGDPWTIDIRELGGVSPELLATYEKDLAAQGKYLRQAYCTDAQKEMLGAYKDVILTVEP